MSRPGGGAPSKRPGVPLPAQLRCGAVADDDAGQRQVVRPAPLEEVVGRPLSGGQLSIPARGAASTASRRSQPSPGCGSPLSSSSSGWRCGLDLGHGPQRESPFLPRSDRCDDLLSAQIRGQVELPDQSLGAGDRALRTPPWRPSAMSSELLPAGGSELAGTPARGRRGPARRRWRHRLASLTSRPAALLDLVRSGHRRRPRVTVLAHEQRELECLASRALAAPGLSAVAPRPALGRTTATAAAIAPRQLRADAC